MPDLMASDVDPAVRAAAEAITLAHEAGLTKSYSCSDAMDVAAVAVAAARPLIARQAAAEALWEVAEQMDVWSDDCGPIVDWLRDRAAEYREGLRG